MQHRTAIALLIFTLGLLLPPAPLFAGSEEARVRESAAILMELNQIPEEAIPPSLLKSAYGIAIFPNLLKAGFIVGGRYGTGIMVVRGEDRTWSNPVFFSLLGGSVGFQIGVQASDIILVFNSIRSLDSITGGKFTLGADASIAAGPVGRHAEAGTDIQLRAEILSYSRSRGIFGGIALEGAAIQVDYEANSAFYNNNSILPMEIFRNRNLPVPPAVDELKRVLNLYTTQ